MKVHRFQIDVMWLFLSVSFCEVATEEMNGFTHRTIRLNVIQKKLYSPIQIRPPP